MQQQDRPELWAGAECTVNRVQDRYFDQLRRTGHHGRLEDMERFAELGASAVRFPVLWERVAPDGLRSASFAWSDVRLQRLRALGIRPIVGLLHHGSGPRGTDLCDPEFPQKFARYARAVAERYPWVDAYTPINEPLTTARFAALYGHWYPHRHDTASFLVALTNQVFATVRAMREIRAVNPRAELYQTEDTGQTFATEPLVAQARYENDRRWLSFDLLFGRVDRSHPLRRHLEEHGVPARALDELVAEPCPPNLLGLNYYLTSDRFLDHRRELYPERTWGGNGHQTYADVEAVRVLGSGIVGHEALLEQAIARYRVSCAITEVHVGCHREEQLRWLYEAWMAACSARQRGLDVRAVTLWSLFGSVDWTSLVTEERNEYEPGAFDVRSSPPQRTAIFDLARCLATGRDTAFPALEGEGWWRCDTRLTYPPVGPCRSTGSSKPSAPLIVLADGALARRVSGACDRRRLSFQALAVDGLHGVPDALARTAAWGIVLPEAQLHALTASVNGSLPRLRILALSEQTIGCLTDEPHTADAALDRLIDLEPGTPAVL